MAVFAGRMGRRAFLAAYICFVVVRAAVTLATGNQPLADGLCLMPWIWMASRRLHDFDVRWWWSLAPTVIGFVSGFVRGFLAAAHAAVTGEVKQTAATLQMDWTAVAQHSWNFAVGFAHGFLVAVGDRIAAAPIEFLLDSILLLVLLLWPGTSGANRFGDPPGRKVAQSA